MLAALFEWWLARMRELIPGQAARTGRAPDAIIVTVARMEDGAGRILLRRGGRESVVRAFSPGDARPPGLDAKLPVGLRLPEGAVLAREVELPLAAAGDIESVIGFEMDRLTPFAADEVFWGISARRRDVARERIGFRLAIVRRDQVRDLIGTLGRKRMAPDFIEGGGARIRLAAAADGRRRAGLTALCAVLVAGCVAAPVLRQQLALDAAARTIARLEPAARQASGLRQRLAMADSGRAAIARERRGGDAMRVLAALTTALPDGTWLGDLALKDGRVTFDGHSSDAAGLIARLSGADGFSDPRFTAPVTRAAGGGADLFAMSARVGG